MTDYSADESLIAVAAEGIGTVEIDVRHVTEADRRAIVDWLEAAVR